MRRKRSFDMERNLLPIKSLSKTPQNVIIICNKVADVGVDIYGLSTIIYFNLHMVMGKVIFNVF